MMTSQVGRRTPARILSGLMALAAVLVAGVGTAAAFTYTSGDVLYVAYQSPSGPNYIVNLGPRTNFLNATTTLTFPDVTASDLNGVIGASAANIFVGLFGVRNPSTHDGIVSANGPINDVDLGSLNALGATNQIDSFGGGVALNSLAVPSGNPNAGKFASSGSFGSYQSTLDAVNAGSLGNNIQWNVETQLSDGSGARNPAVVNIQFYSAIRNTFLGIQSRALIGFFALNPNGTLTYSPDADGDFVPDDIDKCPGVYSPDNSDADGDGRAPACDCDPLNATAWSIPTEVASLTFSNLTSFAWTAPADPGGSVFPYDVLRAVQLSSGPAPAYACFQPNLSGLTSSDATTPPTGQVFFYLVRAGNTCGEGVAGTQSNGQPVPAPACP